MRVGLVGVTGQVGQVLVDVLASRRLDVFVERVFASPASAGSSVAVAGRSLIVESTSDTDFSDLDVVIMSAGASLSRSLAPQIAADGAVVIDNSSAWRSNDAVPLVVPGVNSAEVFNAPLGIVANPNCTTAIAMMAVKPLCAAFGVRRVTATTFQAASGAGRAGVVELAGQLELLAPISTQLVRSSELFRPSASVFPAPLAGNVVPLAGELGADGWSVEERKFIDESRKILALPSLAVSATCVRVPVVTGHCVSLNVRTVKPASRADVEAVLAAAAGVRIAGVPTPLAAVGVDDVLAGRVREEDDGSVSLFVAGDNLRRGAATNAVQIAELLGLQS